MKLKSFIGGASIGSLGGLIGLGGAEFRLPFLVGVLKIDTLHAVMLNIIISLVTVFFALIFRGIDESIYSNFYIVANLLAGTLIGAYIGANKASSIDKQKLNGYIFILLVFLSFVLFSHLFFDFKSEVLLPLPIQIVLGFLLGVGIGMISSLLGVAGGELLIPTIVLLYSVDIKTAGTLSLLISFPTLLVGIYKYNKTKRLQEVFGFKEIIIYMAIGSIIGAFIGALAYGIVDALYLEALLGVILLISAYKLFSKKKA
ncbi:sulfite exporter TauE/SafE family protein [Sulfurimonas crateris]|uniref:Probable membrane transporter protein n=1 Tax=Sulfurimonas crateris TaxID=2574727 RepID=A0A4U2Z9L8_9BACT|nr:sulfite exporter TauE/SafE family protein [Sulfurimonas crateris]TKI70210.1 sulfite exporter TauE/SafE family protein [Sulfurimonas crateris]